MSRLKWCSLTTAALFLWHAPWSAALAQNHSAPRQAGLAKLQEELTALKLEILKAEAVADELKDEERVASTEQQGAESNDTRFFRAPKKSG